MSIIYVGGDTVNVVRRLISDDLSLDSSGSSYGGTIKALALGDYLYVVGETQRTVQKLHAHTLALVVESGGYGGDILAMILHGGYLYIAGATTRTVRKLDPDTLATVTDSANYGGTIYALTGLGDNVYCGGSAGTFDPKLVWQIRASDMAKIAESADYGRTIQSLAVCDGYVYAGGASRTSPVAQEVWMLDPADMSKVAESASYGGSITALYGYDSHIYLGGGGTRLWQLRASDLVFVRESQFAPGAIYAITEVDDYIYIGGAGEIVYKLNPYPISGYPAGLSKIAESAVYGGYIYALAAYEAADPQTSQFYYGTDSEKLYMVVNNQWVLVGSPTHEQLADIGTNTHPEIDTQLSTLTGGTQYVAGVGGVNAYQIVYVASDGRILPADGTNSTHAGRVAGFVTKSLSEGDSGLVYAAGVIENPAWALVAGTIYYLSVGGDTTDTPPGAGFLQRVGRAVSSTAISIGLGEPIILA